MITTLSRSVRAALVTLAGIMALVMSLVMVPTASAQEEPAPEATENTDNTDIVFGQGAFTRYSFEQGDEPYYSGNYSRTRDGFANSDRGVLNIPFSVSNDVNPPALGDTFWLELPLANPEESQEVKAFNFINPGTTFPLTVDGATPDAADVEIGTCSVTTARVTCEITDPAIAQKTDIAGTISVEVHAVETMPSMTPQLQTHAGLTTATMPQRTWSQIPDPNANPAYSQWVEDTTYGANIGIIPRDDITRPDRTWLDKAGDWGPNANAWRMYFGKNHVDNGSVVVVDKLNQDQVVNPDWDLELTIRKYYEHTDPYTGIKYRTLGLYRNSEKAAYPGEPLSYEGKIGDGIQQGGVTVTTEINEANNEITFTITGLEETEETFDYRLSFSATHESELDEYTNLMQVGEDQQTGKVIRPNTTPGNSGRIQYADRTGSFSITKNTLGEAPSDAEYTFKYTVDGGEEQELKVKGDGEAVRAGVLPAGATVTLWEVDPTTEDLKFEAPKITGNGVTVSGEGFDARATFTIPNRSEAAVLVTNSATAVTPEPTPNPDPEPTPNPSSGSSTKCVATAAALALPLLFAVPVAMADQLRIPGLQGLHQRISESAAQANSQLQDALGIRNAEASRVAAQINNSLRGLGFDVAHNPQVQQAGQIAGTIAVVGVAAAILAHNCGAGASSSQGGSAILS